MAPALGASAVAAGAVDVDFEASADAAFPELGAFAAVVDFFLLDFLVDFAFFEVGWVDVAALFVLVPVSALAAGAVAGAAAGAAVCAAAVSETANALASSALNNLVIVCPQFELDGLTLFFFVSQPLTRL
ncbi:MAG TPA: hypothetical protein VEN29_14180 [Casimicrobiaceae bacterium]|nr:hypothetical protein [Casimicrobiaceae bacterium]